MGWTNFQLPGVPQGAREAIWQNAGMFWGQTAWAQILDTPTQPRDLGVVNSSLCIVFSYVDCCKSTTQGRSLDTILCEHLPLLSISDRGTNITKAHKAGRVNSAFLYILIETI